MPWRVSNSYSLLPITHYPLPITHYPLPIPCSLFPLYEIKHFKTK
ncbi:MAG: hypothetical protein ACRCU2_30770 [Planktothrix sp.]